MRRVYKVRNGVICGVCGGLGDYFSIDPVILRILMVCFGFTGFGILAYFICAAVMPYQDQL